jgi:hypothetical protein
LKTPELAAAQAFKEQERLPGISAAIAEDTIYERKQIEAEKKAEQERAKAEKKAEQKRVKFEQRTGKYSQPVLNGPVDTNTVALPNP